MDDRPDLPSPTRAEELPAGIHRSSSVLAAAPGAKPRRHNVLYVEDTASNIRLVARILAMRPRLTVLTTPSGVEGIRTAEERQPDLILLDMHLPDLDGLEVLAALRSNPATSKIPVAALSADATQQRIATVLAAGAIEYITKPISVNGFLASIDNLLHQIEDA